MTVLVQTDLRRCGLCDRLYRCAPRWSPRSCPACHGQRIAQANARRGVGRPPRKEQP